MQLEMWLSEELTYVSESKRKFISERGSNLVSQSLMGEFAPKRFVIAT